MVVDDPLARNALEAVAFGRVVTPEDAAAAARALQALRELDERASAARTRVAGIPAVAMPGGGGVRKAAAGGAATGPVIVEVVDDSDAMSYGEWSRAPSRVTAALRRFWVIPVVIASIALGAVGGSVATRAAENSRESLTPAAQSTVTPNENYTVPDSTGPDQPSDAAVLASVEAWFSLPRQPSDPFPDEAALAPLGIDPNSTHFVPTGGTMRLWAARGLDGGLCLVMLTTADGKSVQYGCIPEQQFPANGVSLAADNGASAHWNADGTIESTG